MFDSKCSHKEIENSNKEKVINILNVLLQTCMAGLLIYVPYRLIYRPLVLGVDILSYTLVDVGLACLMYLVLNRCFLLIHGMYNLKSWYGVAENFATYTLNLLLAYKIGYSLYYSRNCFIFVCVLFFVNLLLSYIGVRRKQFEY